MTSPASACIRSGARISPCGRRKGSAIEASKIAGHATVSQTSDYTVVQLKRQEELTRAIQGRRAKATAENPEKEKQKLATVEAA